jgi:hypothetical protein
MSTALGWLLVLSMLALLVAAEGRRFRDEYRLWLARRRQTALDRHIDQALALCDTPIFAETVADMPQVAERSIVDEAEAILRSAGGAA